MRKYQQKSHPSEPGVFTPAAQLEKIRNSSDQARLISNVLGAAAALTDANRILLAQAVFEEFSKPADTRDEKRLSEYIKLAFKGRTVDLAQDRFHFDAAKSASRHAAEIQRINDAEGDETEKVQRVIKLLFGERPDNTTFQPEPDPSPAEAQ